MAQARGPAPHRRAQGEQHRGPGAARPPDGEATDHRRDRRGPARRGHGRLLRAGWARLRGLHGRRGRPATGAQRPADAALRRHGAPGRERQPHAQGRDERGDPRLGDERRDHLLRHRQRRRSAPVPDPGAGPAAGHRRRGARAVDRALGGLPDAVVACVGGGSNAMGAFTAFVADPAVRLVAVEAGGEGLATGKHGASLTAGRFGVLHGSASSVLQTDDGQVAEAHSVSAGLDYPGVGPGARVPPGHRPARRPDRRPTTRPWRAFRSAAGWRASLPALETAHALARARDVARELGRGKRLLVNLSGRGDKDLPARARGDGPPLPRSQDVSPPRRGAATVPLAVLVISLAAACASSAPGSGSARPAAATATASAPEVPVPAPTLRLPTDVRPTSERISLRLDPRASTYTGTVRIQLAVSAQAAAFWLHARDLTIRRAVLVQGGVERPARTATAPPDLLAIVPATPLVPGQAELTLDFGGTLDVERSRGLYKVEEGDSPYLYTFFEPVDARRAFPCFDEPSFKIPWELTLTVPPGKRRLRQCARGRARPRGDGWARSASTHPAAAQLPGRVRRGPVRGGPGRARRPPPDAAALHHPPRSPGRAGLRQADRAPHRDPARGGHRRPLPLREARRPGGPPLLGHDGAPRPGRAGPAADAHPPREWRRSPATS